MEVNDRRLVGSTLVYCYICTNNGFVTSSTFAAPWIACKVPLYRIPFMANHRRLCLQWAHEHRGWQTDWHQVVFSDESRFNWGTMMAAFVLDAMLVNLPFRVRYRIT
ncbi:uncharacterized protein TNCV_2161851 [Trichonephila clavipes]|nr:uncharacterized protein TNCV_2161851 [Trichonephila clavipes]